PFKPTIRFVTPVFDRTGKPQGLVVLNYLGDKLLEKLAIPGLGKAQLLNSDGYWLAGPSPEQEWGFMFPDRQERSLAHELPDEWERIDQRDAGQFRTAGGLYTFRTVYPLRDLRLGSGEGVPAWLRDKYRWKLLSHVDQARLAAASAELWAA